MPTAVREGKPVTIRLPFRYRYFVLFIPAAIAYFFLRVLVADVYYREAMSLKEQVYLDPAAATLRRALFWQPGNALYYRELGRIYMAMSPWRQDGTRWISDAMIAYRQSVDLNPWDSTTLFDLAIAEVAANNLEKAEEVTLSGLHVDPNNPAFYIMLGTVYGSQGKLVQARTALERALALSPFQQDKIRNELQWIDRVAPRNPEEQNPAPQP